MALRWRLQRARPGGDRAGRSGLAARHPRFGSAGALAVGLVVFAACVDQGPGPQGKKIAPSYVAEHLVAEPPARLSPRLDVSIGGKVIYLGNTVDRTIVAPGQTVRITHYWRVIAPVGPEWRVFALVRGAPDTADFMNLPETDMERGHGPERWKAGEVIEDVQDITLRPDWRSRTAMVTVGLIASGQHGVGDRMAATGPHTQDRAVLARVLEVDLSKAPPPPGTVYVRRAQGPITIDGVASEPAWAAAGVSSEFATAEGSADPVGKATARLTWDDEYLYAFVAITDSDVWTEYRNHDDPLWKQDCVELFVDADGNRRGYVELQVNPNNATFDSWFATTRAKPGDPSWDSGMLTQVKLRGTVASGDTDQGWDVEIAIPWHAVRGRDEAMAVRLPPEVGDRWRMNIVRVDVKTGDKNPGASSWNRITSADFHALDRMLTVVFADAAGSIVAAAPSDVAGAGSAGAPGAASSGSAAPPAAGSAAPPTSHTGAPGAAPGGTSGARAAPPAAGNATPATGRTGDPGATPAAGSAGAPGAASAGSAAPPASRAGSASTTK